VLVLLPPSEGKAAPPRRGAPLDLGRLSFPELKPVRSQLLTSLVELCSGDVEKSRATLGLSPGLTAEIERNRSLLRSPARPAADVYTGVLYDSLGLASLPPDARRRANRSLLVFSGLWGVLRLGDRIPSYRLSADVTLPGLGTLTSLWREPLAVAMETVTAKHLVLDLRSSSYAPLWRATGAVADRTVELRVLQERTPGDPGSRVVVSHFNKATKGRLVRSLLMSGATPRRPVDLVRVLGELGFVAEPTPGFTHRPGRPHQVDVVVTAL
jgi:cytoplasmic iron level regulating protein YaaA (DUF328/UPF0246 family)